MNSLTKQITKDSCDTCYQIACKKCDWKASDMEALEIQKGKLTNCPKCGWKPTSNPSQFLVTGDADNLS